MTQDRTIEDIKLEIIESLQYFKEADDRMSDQYFDRNLCERGTL